MEILLRHPLSEGCIAGVMRKVLIEKLSTAGTLVAESPLNIADLESADEIFLTNAISGIRWVKQFRNKKYSHTKTYHIYKQFVQTFWQ